MEKRNKKVGATPNKEIKFYQNSWTEKAIQKIEKGEFGKSKKGTIEVSPQFTLVFL